MQAKPPAPPLNRSHDWRRGGGLFGHRGIHRVTREVPLDLAQAGFVVDPMTSDWDSRDGTIHATGGKRPKIDFQAKCHATAPLPEAEASFSFDLPVKNYEELRNPDLIFRHLLFVILVPRDTAERVSVTEQALVLRHCGYWLSLRGLPETTNSQTCRVHVPRANVLDVSGLTALMMRLNQGEII